MPTHKINLKKITKTEKRINLLKNSSILSLPSVFGILLALLAIPIHLQVNGKSDYGNYIFFHFVISFGLLLNFGINKITAIEIAKKKSVNQIITQSLKISFKIILIFFLIQLIILLFLDNYKFSLLIISGLSLTIIYLNLEGILQGLKNFKLLSIANFTFYTLSLNIPSIALLYIENIDYYELIKLSIIFKFFTIAIILINLKKFLKNRETGRKYNFYLKLKKYSKWYFLHFLNIQIYDLLDKYLIKIFIGPIALAIYSIPYQLAGKITIFSKSISAVLLPEISFGKEKESFNYSIKIFCFLIPIILLLIFPYLDWLLSFWLKNQYSNQILDLTKIFLITSWISGISHLLIVYFEGKKKIKYNTLLELYFIIPFLIILFFVSIKLNNLIYIAFVILIKEFILLIFRIEKIKYKIISIYKIYINLMIILINLMVNLYAHEYFFISFTILIGYNLILFFNRLIK